MNPFETWLSEYARESTRKENRKRFNKFLKWCKKTPSELVKEFDKNKTKTLVLQWQNHLLNVEKKKQNSVRTYVNTVRAFFSSQCEQLNLKGKIVKQQLPTGEHIFSIEDLKAMHSIANTEDKAILSLACSLGWHAKAFLGLERSFVEDLIKRAKTQKQDFIRFDWVRKKTNKPICGILTPIAMFDVEKHILKNNPKPKLFNLDADTLNRRIKNLAKEANVQTIGKVSFKLFRKWLMDTLDSANLTEFQSKIIVGKTVASADLTYLQRLKRRAFERYKKSYPTHLSLTQNVNGTAKYNELVDLVTRHVKAQSELVDYMKSQGMVKDIPANISEQLKEVFEFAKIMKKKNGEKVESHEDKEEKEA